MKGSEHEPFERRIMKKKFIPLVIAVATLMASCNHPSSPTTSSNIGTGTSQVAKYTVTANSSEDFEVTGLEKDGYAEGATVTFRINVKNALKEVERVIVDKKALTPAEDGTYSFTMGAVNVVINITLKDKEGVKTVSLELSNSNPGTGDVVAVTMKLDGVAVTEDVTLEATKGADLVEIAGNLVTCKAVGEVTIKAAATVDGIPYSKEISWTIVEGVTITDIATIQTVKPAFGAKGTDIAETEYTVEGRVVALYKYGCIIKDATGYMQINDTKKGANTVTVGEYIRVTGKPECYKSKATDIRWWVMTENNHAEYALQKVANPAKTVDMPVARTDFTQADLDNYSKNEVRGQAIYLNIKMTAVTNGKFTNLYVGDAKTGVEDMSESGKIVTITGGHAYQVKGFLMENSDGHVKLYATEAAQLPDAVESVAVTGTETMIIGATQQLTAAITPATAPQDVVWSSNAEGVATVSETGLVTAVAAGKATITATAKDTSIVGSIEITVTAAAIAATGITLDATTAEIKLGETKTLVATVTPADSTDTVTWETSDANVATVEGGIVTPVAAGTATITAKVGEFSATCIVTVLDPYGTSDAPLDVKGALQVGKDECKTDKAYSSKEVYVTGKVMTPGTYSEQHKNYTGMVLQSLEDPNVTLTVYRVLAGEGVDAPEANDIVKVHGYMQKYNSNLQMSYKDKSTPTIYANENGSSNVTSSGEHVTFNGLPTEAVANGTSVSFTVTVESGYVLDSVSVNKTKLDPDSEGKYTFTVSGDMAVEALTHKEGEASLQAQTIKYSGSTGNATGNNDAKLLGLDDSVWSVVGNKKSGSNTPGYNKDGTIRLYNNTYITISALKGINIQKVEIQWKIGKGSPILTATTGIAPEGSDPKVVEATDNAYTVADNTITFANTQTTSSQLWISEFVVYYTVA